MKIRMYECGFGDCFRLREKNQRDLYVDFGIHTSSWSGFDKIKRFDGIIGDMNRDKDFLLTHYHDDHFNGAIYMAKNTPHRFNNVYISDVWNMPGSIYVTSLTLLRGIFTKSVLLGENTIIDFLESICNRHGRIHFISRGMKFHNNQYIALWPEKEYVATKAHRLFEKLHRDFYLDTVALERIANRLNRLVITLANGNDSTIEAYQPLFNELREEYAAVQSYFSNLTLNKYNNIQYKLTKFGNEISIVFQNYEADRNVLFTGDFGKKTNWTFIEKNLDELVKMHDYYDVIKLPHHGTEPYYHSFAGRIKKTSIFMIPNGYIKLRWYVSPKYNTHSIITICNGKHTCPPCKCICPKLYCDI